MSKRDHDTEIWSEDWFLDLSDLEMLFWYYITDKCDHAGFWRPNFKMFETITGRRINKDDFLKKINTDKDRIIVLENGRWFLSGFISFQYCGKLNLNNRFHKSIMETFRKNIPEEKTTGYNFEVSLTSIRPQVEVNKERRTKNEERRTEEGGLEETKQDHPKNKKSEFIKPSFDEFEKYCSENKHQNIARRAYDGYDVANWVDSQGKKIKNWKQKLQHVWFKKENEDEKQQQPKTGRVVYEFERNAADKYRNL